MKYFKILPAAAGVIALTAVACFAQDRREKEEADSRTRVMVHSPGEKIAEAPAPAQEESQSGCIYHVEIERGSKINEVVIDAHTGKILGRREMTAKAA